MQIWELIATAVGLAMDAFAVAACKGLSMRRLNVRQALIIGLFFGAFQAVMPMIGWLVGKQFDVRQQRRNLELKRLEDELQRMRDIVDRREKTRKEIIQKRVTEVLDLDRELDF